MYGIFVFKYTSTTEIYTYCLTPSRHGALPCCALRERAGGDSGGEAGARGCVRVLDVGFGVGSCRSNPPCGEAMGRWQREALTEGLWREAAAPHHRLRRRSPSPSLRDREDRMAATSRKRPWPDASLIVPRSEEQTSELQSLMRISYAVFCLK